MTILSAGVSGNVVNKPAVRVDIIAESVNADLGESNSVAPLPPPPPLYPDGAWDVANAVYDSKLFNLSGLDDSPQDLALKDDGVKLYVLGRTGNLVHQLTFGVIDDVSTLTDDSISLNIGAQETAALALRLGDGGTKLYIVGSAGDTVYQYTLSTAWDLSTASYSGKFISLSSEDVAPAGMHFKPDGTKFFMLGFNNTAIYQYTLSTAWDISTATYDTVSFSLTTQTSNPQSYFMHPEGIRLYLCAANNNGPVFQYDLSTPWDISTTVYNSVSYTIGQDSVPAAISWNANGSKMFVIGLGNVGRPIFQYDVSI